VFIIYFVFNYPFTFRANIKCTVFFIRYSVRFKEELFGALPTKDMVLEDNIFFVNSMFRHKPADFFFRIEMPNFVSVVQQVFQTVEADALYGSPDDKSFFRHACFISFMILLFSWAVKTNLPFLLPGIISKSPLSGMFGLFGILLQFNCIQNIFPQAV
jgi:hypothetical protein